MARRLFDDMFSDSDSEDNLLPQQTPEQILENQMINQGIPKEERYIKRWEFLFKENTLNNLYPLPMEKVILPIEIINQLKVLRREPLEYGGPFRFEGNRAISYGKKQGSESELDMDIDPEQKLMYHTHPPYTDRFFSPPSELDVGLLFNNSVNANKCIPHIIFAEEGIYLIYCHSQIINKNYHINALKEDFRMAVDFKLKEYIQDLRLLLGYIKRDGGPKQVIQPKITIDKFMEVINRMGFITKLYEYPESDLEIEIPNNSQILIGGSYPKYKIFYDKN